MLELQMKSEKQKYAPARGAMRMRCYHNCFDRNYRSVSATTLCAVWPTISPFESGRNIWPSHHVIWYNNVEFARVRRTLQMEA